MPLFLNPNQVDVGHLRIMGGGGLYHASEMTNALEQDYRAVQQRAGLIDWPAWGVVEVVGADRATFLHNLLSNDIKTLTPGRGCRAALLTPTAKLIAELLVLAEVERHWLLMPRVCIASALAALDHYLITEDVTLADRTDAWTLLAIQGPNSSKVASALLDASMPEAEGSRIIVGNGLRMVTHSITGLPGLVLMVPPKEAAATRTRLRNDGRQHGLVPVDWEAVNTCRLEAGIPWYGIDMDETTLLPETGLERQLASFTKGCYVGQEIVARLDTYGSLSRKLMGLVCEGTVVPQRGDEIRKDDQPVGQITSACLSPSLQRPSALGYVNRPHYEGDTTVTVLRQQHTIGATLRGV